MPAKTKAIVIGAGLGGLACAAGLLDAGVQTTLLEAGERAGGKCGGTRQDGFCVDFAPHVFPTSRASPIAHAARLVGEEIRFVVRDPFALVLVGERRFHLPANPGGLVSLASIVLGGGVRLRHLLGIGRHFLRLVSGVPDLDPARPTSVRDWARAYTADDGYHGFLNLFCILAFVVPYDVADAGEFAASFSGIAAGPGIGYPLGGCENLIDTLVRGIRARGGRLLLGQRAARIHTASGAVRAVQTASDCFEADLVFSNAGIKSTLALLDDAALDEGYLARARGLLESLGAVTVAYRLDRRVLDVPAVLVFPGGSGEEICEAIRSGRFIGQGGSGCYVVVPSNFDPSLAPPGQQIVLATTIHPANLRAAAGTARATLESLEAGLFHRFPGLERSIIHRTVTTSEDIARVSGRTTGEAIGVAQVLNQGGRRRPSFHTPVRGLYVVGADTGSGAVGTELAAKSGLEAAARCSTGRGHAKRQADRRLTLT